MNKKEKPQKSRKNKKPVSIEKQIGFVLDSLNTLVDDQVKFKEEVSKQVKDIRDDMGTVNVPSQSDLNTFVPVPAPQQTASSPEPIGTGSGNDYIKDGVNFGKNSPTYLADMKKGQTVGAPVGGQNFQGWGQTIASIFAQPEVGANLINAVKELIKPKAQFDSMFTQFVMRDFLENYSQSKVMNKAMMGMMVKKGFLEQKDVEPFMNQQETLFDPIKQTIEKMKSGAGQ